MESKIIWRELSSKERSPYELLCPGVEIIYPNKKDKLMRWMSLLKTTFSEICAIYLLYENSKNRRCASAEDSMMVYSLVQKVRDEVAAKMGLQFTNYIDNVAIKMEANRHILNRYVNEDFVNRQMLDVSKQVLAKSFISSIALTGKIIEKMIVCTDDGSPERINLKAAQIHFLKQFPDAKSLRDSIQHIDERVIGEANNSMIKQIEEDAEVGDNIVSGLSIDLSLNDTFCTTCKDGKLGRMDIVQTSVEHLRDSIELALNAFQWSGKPEMTPYFW